MSETEVAAFELNILDPKRIRVFREKGTPRMTLEGDRSWTKVQVTRAFPAFQSRQVHRHPRRRGARMSDCSSN